MDIDLRDYIMELQTEKLNSTDCARALKRIVDSLRETSFYSKNHKVLSHLRFRRFFEELEKDPTVKEKISHIFRLTLQSFDLSTLVTQTGLSQNSGFLSELSNRIIGRILPHHSPKPNFMALVNFLFPHPNDAIFIRKITCDLIDKILILFDEEIKDPLKGRYFLGESFDEQLDNSLMVLAAKCLVISENHLINDIRWKLSTEEKKAQPFLKLHQLIYKLNSEGYSKDLETKLIHTINDSRDEIAEILNHLEEGSVSIDLVYQIEVLQLLLDRIYALLTALILPKEVSNADALAFFSTLIKDEHKRRSIRMLIAQNTHFLARKIVERAGETGEHYIARNPQETKEMLQSSLGGGFVTAFTALFKILIHHVQAALFFQGVFNTINFAGSFVFMHFMHLTLATKQPAMTAAALAKKMTSLNSDLKGLREEMKNLLRSQSYAALGNLTAVIPTAYCLYLIWNLFFDTNFISPEEARYILNAHNPLMSLTILYSIFTGVILWSSSLVYGWAQNWMVFRGIPELLTESFLLENFLSTEKRKSLSQWLNKHLPGIASSVALGALLAFTPTIGSFFGLPLEVRHVTLTMGALTLAWASLPVEELTPWMFINGFSAVFIILLGNLLTSFALSLWLALRSKGWHIDDIKNDIKQLLFWKS
jgi:site-specific recombinase